MHPSPQSEALRAEVEGVKQDLGELEELRELRADVERKEKQQAAIIENQVGTVAARLGTRGGQLRLGRGPLGPNWPADHPWHTLLLTSLPALPPGPQAKRLEELDKVYRDEVVARKRAHNALEDAKGKIRVFARIRPLLDFEAARKQVRCRACCWAPATGAKRL